MTDTAVQLLVVSVHAMAALATAGHALLNKRDPRSAWAWVTACWLFPLAGAVLYVLFGINRIERRARRTFGAAPARHAGTDEPLPDVPGVPQEVCELVRLGRVVTGRPLMAGNRVTPLHNGEQAYPDMLAGIARAQRTVWLQSYIFDRGEVAATFAEALGAARRRGAQVRVLLDGVGTFTGSGIALLEKQGIRPSRFLPLRLWPPNVHVNLRNHHKLLTVDGEVAWTGGMNVADEHFVKRGPDAIADLHFRIEGPVVPQLEAVFADDWRFTAHEPLAPSAFVPVARGETFCRAITDGPNEVEGTLQLVLLAAIANAHRRICVMTPYFIPTPEIWGALQSAALRGVAIDLVLPRCSDQWWVDCATRRWLAQLVGHRVHVYYRPPPFAHTKLFLMDDYYAVVGSANLDPRSLRLNFELVVELYDAAVVRGLRAHFDEVRDASHEVTAQWLRRRPPHHKLRDAVLWLFSPYL